MDEPQPSAAPPALPVNPEHFHAPVGAPPGTAWLVKTAGAMGVLACIIGLGILLTACGGYGEAFRFAMVPLALGTAGLLLTPLGYFAQKAKVMAEETQVLAALFASAMGIIGGMLELAIHRGWPLLH